MTHRALLVEVGGPAYADDTEVLRTNIANLYRKSEPRDAPPRYIVLNPASVPLRRLTAGVAPASERRSRRDAAIAAVRLWIVRIGRRDESVRHDHSRGQS